MQDRHRTTYERGFGPGDGYGHIIIEPPLRSSERQFILEPMRDEGDMIAPAPTGSLGCLELCAMLGATMIMIYVLLTMALVLLA